MSSSRLLIASALVVVCVATARADDVAWLSKDAVLEQRGKAAAFVLLVARADDQEVKDVEKLLQDKKAVKAPADSPSCARLDPGDEEGLAKLGLPAKAQDRVFVLDGYAALVEKHAKVPAVADTLGRSLKLARESTAKKKKVEKQLDGAVAKAEASIKKEDPRAACEQLQGVLAYDEKLPCPAVETAKKLRDELAEKGKTRLEDARAATRKSDFGGAQKIIGEVAEKYPLPAVQEESKKVREELAQAMNRAKGS